MSFANVRGLWLLPTEIAQDFYYAICKVQAWKLLIDSIPFVPSQLAAGSLRTYEIGRDASRAERDFDLFKLVDAACAVEGYSIPDKLDTMLIPARGFAAKEFSRCVSTIDFETLMLGDEAASLVPPGRGVWRLWHEPPSRDWNILDLWKQGKSR